ncbi:substrate-binding domain-containing protein [Streptomyces sp. NPDC093250]|uniref:substrate-binding domain-containing protein n=1 Tax=Streptomyces sp. NPDC093250 TaxID=3366036 RepID=UPI003818911E
MRQTAVGRLRRTPLRAVVALSLVTWLSACSAGGTATVGSDGAGTQAVAIDPATLGPKGIVGKGPNGESPASVDSLQLSPADAAKVRAKKFKVAISVQTMSIDWAKLQVRGITDTLNKYGAQVVGVINPEFQVDKQVAGIENMIQRKPDAFIGIPVDDTATAPAFKKIGQSGIKLILMDNIPKGLSYPQDYQSMVSADSEGNGWIAAQGLAAQVPKGGTVGIIGFGVDFFVTNERVRGVKDWFAKNRPDVKIKESDFTDADDAQSVTENFLTANPDVKGVFVVWDAPAMGAVTAARTLGRNIPVTTIDLGLQAATEMAKGGLIKAVGAQRPYDQGVAEALAALNSLIGKQPAAWIGVQSLPVVQKNVLQQYKTVWHTDPPKDLVDACNVAPACDKSN